VPRKGHTRRIALIPSVSGGLGHVTRLSKLARALKVADPSLELCFVLPERRLRAVNVEAVRSHGYPVRMLPDPVRHERDDLIRDALGDIDVVIEDTERRLIAYRHILPRLTAWISIPMLPLWDELFMDGPLLEHADHILFTYPDVMPVPAELERFVDKLTVTGPFGEPAPTSARQLARRRLGLGSRQPLITYAPRGFPFGRAFGERVLNAVVGGFLRVRREREDARLTLTGVPDVSAIQPRRLPPLDQIDGLEVKGMIAPDEVAAYVAAADIVVLEGTSTLFEAARAGTPVIMVPGPIYETLAEAAWLEETQAGTVLRPGEATRRNMAERMTNILDDRPAAVGRSARLSAIVGPGGEAKAVAVIFALLGWTTR
jgi:glycosyltransferase involved in cell wall biosynthesis